MDLVCRNPFLFRGPIPTPDYVYIGSEDLVAIPSYSEVLFLQKLITCIIKSIVVAIPSYSEVLFLRGTLQNFTGNFTRRNPFLFRGPIPTEIFNRRLKWKKQILCRNPFLFRGPIPTEDQAGLEWAVIMVAIPSYSEVLFLPFG